MSSLGTADVEDEFPMTLYCELSRLKEVETIYCWLVAASMRGLFSVLYQLEVMV